MVTYNPKDWVKLIFQFHKSDTFRQLLPALIGMGIYTAFLAWLENSYFKSKIHDLSKVHNIVGFVLSMLLVFRINSAYDRWYEGRKLWGGLVNNTRSLAIKINAALSADPKQLREKFRILLGNYVVTVKEHLRSSAAMDELDNTDAYTDSEFKAATHKPNFIAVKIQNELQQLYKAQKIDSNELYMLSEEVKQFTEITGGCERIKNTPIPYSYSLFLKKIIFLYVFTLPIGYVIDFDYWAIPICVLVFYVFASIELISEEIEEPFGTDSNDLPTDEICVNIKNNLSEILK